MFGLDLIALGRKDRSQGGFFNLAPQKTYLMKTIVYIDGFNLYYGALKGTPYKWLDVVKLVNTICHIQNPATNLIGINFFTSPVKAKIATHGEQAVHAQNAYLKALRVLYPDLIRIIEGYFTLEEAGMPRYQNPLVKSDRVSVWRLEEKKTDVQLAIQMYRDVCQGIAEQIVLVSNDTDQEPALNAIKLDFPSITIGLVIPRFKLDSSEKRPSNRSLEALATWTRSYVLESELSICQLPNLVPTKKKPVYKPSYW